MAALWHRRVRPKPEQDRLIGRGRGPVDPAGDGIHVVRVADGGGDQQGRRGGEVEDSGWFLPGRRARQAFTRKYGPLWD